MLDTDEDLLEKQVKAAAEAPLRVYLDWGRYDRRGTREAWDMRVANPLRGVPARARLPSGGRRGARGRGLGGLAQPHRPGVRGTLPGARAPPDRYSFLTSTFERRPLASYFARRAGGRSSGVPSTKPPFDWK